MSRRADDIDDLLRREAARWHALMRGPDAEAQRPGFERWCAERPENLAAYNRIAGDFAAMKRVTRAEVDQAVARRSRSRAKVIASLAGLMLIAGMGAVMLASREASPPPVRLATKASEAGRFRLGDGSSVTLRPASRIDVGFTEGERRVEFVDGHVRFEVAHDTGRPFRVDGAGWQVEAIGTTFDIWKTGNVAEVHLLDGLIEVRRRSPRLRPALLVLRPGERVTLEAGETALAGDRDARTVTREYDDISLGDLVAEANREAGTSIRLAHPGLAWLRVSGRFDIADSDRLADSVARTFGLELDRSAPGVLVLGRARDGIFQDEVR